MKEYWGKSASEGIVRGRIFLYQKREYAVHKYSLRQTAGEMERFEEALLTAREQLGKLQKEAELEAGAEQAEIFSAHLLLLEDQEYLKRIREAVSRGHVSAEFAVQQAGEGLKQQFLEMKDEYMRARSADIEDVSRRLLGILSGEKEEERTAHLKEPGILLARDLTPSETINLNREMILGIVTVEGSFYSHTAILARSMGIPALVGTQVELLPDLHGKNAILDGIQGRLLTDPDEETIAEMEKLVQKQVSEKQKLMELKEAENKTLSGRSIAIYANIGSPEEVAEAMEAGAGAIGLLRSEYLYLGRNDYPGEEELFQSYLKVIQQMKGKKVIIRTLDIGADKKAEYFGLEQEENPALGYRAIRVCLDRPELFKTQLRAIYRASTYGKTGIMFPMIVSCEEVKKIKELAAEAVEELKRKGQPAGNPELGIMIETPAAALLASKLAPEVDFFSIGTNDLTQYTLAADRGSSRLASFYASPSEAVLTLIRMTVEAAHRAGIKVGICGELAADLSLTEKFIEMGVDGLSVAPAGILKLRHRVRSLS